MEHWTLGLFAHDTLRDCSATMLKRLVWILNILTTAVKELCAEGAQATLVIGFLLAHKEEGKKAICILQDYAKKMADMHTLTACSFSASKGQVLSLMSEKSAASRMVELAFIQHITPQQVEYVQCKFPFVDNHASAQILDLVGGHFAHLNQAAMRLKSGVSFEQMQGKLGERTRQIGNSANTLQKRTIL